jgi:hypothetical protein
MLELTLELFVLSLEEVPLLAEILLNHTCILLVSIVCCHALLHNKFSVVEVDLLPSWGGVTVGLLDVVESVIEGILKQIINFLGIGNRLFKLSFKLLSVGIHNWLLSNMELFHVITDYFST